MYLLNQKILLFSPKINVSVCDALVFCSVCSDPGGGFTGIFISIVWGLLKVVVIIKNVTSRNPRSTIGVRSTLVDAFLDPFFLSFLMTTALRGI